MTRHPLALGAAAALVALVLAGCTGDTSGSDQSPDSSGSRPAEDRADHGDGRADQALVPRPCDLFTEAELAELAGSEVSGMTDNPGLSECWVDGNEVIIYRFSAITPAAWDWNRSYYEDRGDTAALPGGGLGDDSYLKLGPDVTVLVRTGPIQVAVVHSAFAGEQDAATAGAAIAGEIIARADLSAAAAAAGMLPDVAPCELLTEEEFTSITMRTAPA